MARKRSSFSSEGVHRHEKSSSPAAVTRCGTSSRTSYTTRACLRVSLKACGYKCGYLDVENRSSPHNYRPLRFSSTPAASTSLCETKAAAPNSHIDIFPTRDEQLVIFARHLWTVLFLIERTPHEEIDLASPRIDAVHPAALRVRRA
jgi:hypothetical protein